MLISLLALALHSSSPAMANPNAAVSSAISRYGQGRHLDALKKLDTALAEPDALKERARGKAYVYRARVRLALVRSGEAASLELDAPLIRSAEDLEAARAFDMGSLGRQIGPELDQVTEMLLFDAASVVNDGGSLASVKVKARYEHAVRQLDVVTRVWPTQYQAYDLRGQCRMALADGDSEGRREILAMALEDFASAARAYADDPPDSPDLSAVYHYIHLAMLSDSVHGDSATALDFVEQGKATLAAEWKRAEESQGDYAPSSWDRLSSLRSGALETLSQLELNLYVANPELHEAALPRFEAETKRNPDDASVWVIYAILLDQAGVDGAVAAYEKAWQLGHSASAAFNLGSRYNNRALVLLQKAADHRDRNTRARLRKQAQPDLENAAVWFERVNEARPGDQVALQALENIYVQLERPADVQRIRSLRNP